MKTEQEKGKQPSERGAHPANGKYDHTQHLAEMSGYNGHGTQAGAHPTGSPCPTRSG